MLRNEHFNLCLGYTDYISMGRPSYVRYKVISQSHQSSRLSSQFLSRVFFKSITIVTYSIRRSDEGEAVGEKNRPV